MSTIGDTGNEAIDLQAFHVGGKWYLVPIKQSVLEYYHILQSALLVAIGPRKVVDLLEPKANTASEPKRKRLARGKKCTLTHHLAGLANVMLPLYAKLERERIIFVKPAKS